MATIKTKICLFFALRTVFEIGSKSISDTVTNFHQPRRSTKASFWFPISTISETTFTWERLAWSRRRTSWTGCLRRSCIPPDTIKWKNKLTKRETILTIVPAKNLETFSILAHNISVHPTYKYCYNAAIR